MQHIQHQEDTISQPPSNPVISPQGSEGHSLQTFAFCREISWEAESSTLPPSLSPAPEVDIHLIWQEVEPGDPEGLLLYTPSLQSSRLHAQVTLGAVETHG